MRDYLALIIIKIKKQESLFTVMMILYLQKNLEIYHQRAIINRPHLQDKAVVAVVVLVINLVVVEKELIRINLITNNSNSNNNSNNKYINNTKMK